MKKFFLIFASVIVLTIISIGIVQACYYWEGYMDDGQTYVKASVCKDIDTGEMVTEILSQEYAPDF